MGFLKVLKLFGVYKVNEDYTKELDEKLEAMEENLGAVTSAADSGSQIVDALNAGNLPKAVEVALEFCKIDDEVKELKGIQEKVKKGDSIEAAVAAADAPALSKELVESTVREVSEHIKKIKELGPSIAEVGEEVAKKLADLPAEAAKWSLAEKIGTPEAVKNTAGKAKGVKDAAAEASSKLESLTKSLNEVKV